MFQRMIIELFAFALIAWVVAYGVIGAMNLPTPMPEIPD
jgi:hypothetical protein